MAKTYTQIFRFNAKWSIQCQWIDTRYGFKHEARIMRFGVQTDWFAKCCYYNRTWETYEYKTVMNDVLVHLKDAVTKNLYTRFYNRINGGNWFLAPKTK